MGPGSSRLSTGMGGAQIPGPVWCVAKGHVWRSHGARSGSDGVHPSSANQAREAAITMKTAEAARGHWFYLLSALGIEERFLVNRHGPCPLCGGRDRFRWDDKDGTGSYYCNQCGPGPGLLLLQKFHGWDFKTAADEIDRVLGQALPPPQRNQCEHRGGSAERLRRLMDSAAVRIRHCPRVSAHPRDEDVSGVPTRSSTFCLLR